VSPEATVALGEILRDAGFGRERHFELLGLPGGVPPVEVLEDLGRDEDARLATFMRLFDTDAPPTADEVARAVTPLTLDELLGTGLAARDGDRIRATVKLSAIGQLIVVGDAGERMRERDLVGALTPAAKAVAFSTPRREVGSALDVCTGSGVQALLAARDAERVVAIDINPRALELAGVSERLNAAAGVSWLAGDWFEPVRGQKFDHVVVNPPVIISPDNEVIARDSELGGHELSRRMVRESAEHLTEGGFATVLCNWAHLSDEWEREPRGWVAGLGCDAIVLHLWSQDPFDYAMANVGRPGLERDEIAETLDRWIAYYEREGIERIAYGIVVLRRRAEEPHWTNAFDVGGEPSGRGGEQIKRMFAGGDALEAMSDDELLDAVWLLVEGHRIDQALVHEGGSYSSAGARLAIDGLNLFSPLDPATVPAIASCDGSHTLREAIGLAGAPVDACLAAAKDAIARGYLLAISA
jgi:SAM-dependent methyltransferase